MLSYISSIVVRSHKRNILLVLGLLSLSSGLSTYVSANQESTVHVSTALDEHWRGAYDILIRPGNAIQPVEQNFGLVESNYLSVGASGISVQQWKKIQSLPGVEIAAPVATIGYLSNIAGNIGISFPPQTETSLFKASIDISSTNGYRTSPVMQRDDYYILQTPPNPLPDYYLDDVVILSTSPGLANGDSPGSIDVSITPPPILWTLVAGIDPDAESALTGLNGTIINGKYLSPNDGYATKKVPEPKSAEDINDARESGGHGENMINRRANKDGPDIPIMFSASSYISLPVTINVERLALPDQEALAQAKSIAKQNYRPGISLEAMYDDLRQGMTGLNMPLVDQLFGTSLDYGSQIKPMSLHALNIDLLSKPPSLRIQSGWEMGEDSFGFAIDKGMENAFRPGSIEYEKYPTDFDKTGRLILRAVPKIDAQTIISLTGEVAFRSLPAAPPAMAPPPNPNEKAFRSPYSFHEVGTYDLNKLPDAVRDPDPLSYVPLGIYTPPLVQMVGDANGIPLSDGPVPLHPTLNPASFIPGPPLALTDIASARFFRGENCIDAVRVRVAGIDRYTPENIAKVEKVAQEIIESTGLHVDIVAGSSPQKVLVYIPGSDDGRIAPLGYVEEQWTTLGAAASIQSGIDQASVLMLGAVGVAGLLYLMSQSLLSTLSRRRELALLQAVGWRRRHISGLVMGEAGILGVLGGLCAVVLALVIAGALGLVAPIEQALGVGVAVFLLYVLASVGPAIWVTRQPVAELLQRGEIAVPISGPSREQDKERDTAKALRRKAGLVRMLVMGNGGIMAVAGFAWRNVTRRRLRALLAAGAVAIATSLLLVLVGVLAALGGTLRVTLLGGYMGLVVQPYHYIMVGSALIVSILTVADHLAMGVLERRHELALLQAVGWRAGAVRLSILFEGLWLGLVGGAIGTLVAVGIAVASKSEAILSAWWVVPIGLVAVMLLCALSALYAIMLTPRQTLVRAIQQ